MLPDWNSLDAVSQFQRLLETVLQFLMVGSFIAAVFTFYCVGQKDKLTDQQPDTLERRRKNEIALRNGEIATLFLMALSLTVGLSSFHYAGQKDKLTDQKQRALELHYEREIAHLKLETAKANERAQNAILEQEKLKAKLAWRTVTPQAKKRLLPVLQKTKRKITIACISNDVESLYFGEQLAIVFRAAGWIVLSQQRTYTGSVIGVIVPQPTTPATMLVREAFKSAAIPFDTSSTLPILISYSSSENDFYTDTTIIVGSKPPAY